MTAKRHEPARHRRPARDILDAVDAVADLTGGLRAIVEQFAREDRSLDDHAIIRQIGLMRSELDKLEFGVKQRLTENA
jgi:hypothetical protein